MLRRPIWLAGLSFQGCRPRAQPQGALCTASWALKQNPLAWTGEEGGRGRECEFTCPSPSPLLDERREGTLLIVMMVFWGKQASEMPEGTSNAFQKARRADRVFLVY